MVEELTVTVTESLTHRHRAAAASSGAVEARLRAPTQKTKTAREIGTRWARSRRTRRCDSEVKFIFISHLKKQVGVCERRSREVERRQRGLLQVQRRHVIEQR